MTERIEKTLYFDPQQAREIICDRCGGATYGPGYHCIRCQRDNYDA